MPKNNKLLVFDLDGTLVYTKEIHFEAFNDALISNHLEPISYIDHLNIYD
jgi:beta-phosphoglucomutase-like phosphatase (HAD superfamily)